MFSMKLFSQIATTIEATTIEILEVKKVSNYNLFGKSQLKISTPELQKVMIKTKIKSINDTKTKLSAFSLLDTVHKIRYRLADYVGYIGFIGSPETTPFRKSRLYKDNGKELKLMEPPFNSKEKDYFNDFDREGYTNYELNINFGTDEKPKLSVIYFGESVHNQFKAELYFAILSVHFFSVYELYYQDLKIGEVKFELYKNN